IVLSHSSGVMSRKLWRMLMPALLMTTSTPPINRTASANAAWTCFRSDTSAARTPASPANSSSSLRRASGLWSSTQTADPSARKRAAVAAPMPLAPPVISTRFDCNPRTRTSANKIGQIRIPVCPRSYHRWRLSKMCRFEQQVVAECGRDSRRPARPHGDCAQAVAVGVVGYLVVAGIESAQFHLAFERRVGRGKEHVIHLAVLFDRIGVRRIEAIDVEILEVALGQHLLVVEADPFLPVFFLLCGQIDSFVFRTGIGPHKFCSHHAARADRGREIIAMFDPVLSYPVHFGKLHVIAIHCRLRPEQRFVHLDAAADLHCADGIGGHGLIHVTGPGPPPGRAP